METVWRTRQAVVEGLPVTTKLCTVRDEVRGVNRNIEVPLGTPSSALIPPAPLDAAAIYIMGGLLSGRSYYSQEMPVTRDTDGLLLVRDPEIDRRGCVRCGQCLEICPVGRAPQAIFRAVRDLAPDRLEGLAPERCIGCGLCAFICPSLLPLLQQIEVGRPAAVAAC
jgi:electron transport complex protein RnfC